jgi:very-short-patch-repair endonuclease
LKIHYNPRLKELARQLRNNSTQSEIKLWKYLKGKQMMGYDFHRQKPIGNYIVDFFCNKLQLVIELDGFSHHFENTYQKDIEKEDSLKKLGITVLRFQDSEVMHRIDEVIGIIQTYIEEFEGQNEN